MTSGPCSFPQSSEPREPHVTWSSPRSQIGSHISHVHSTGASAALAAARQTCAPTKLDRHIHRACCVVLRSTTIRVHPHPHIPLLPASCGQLCLSPGTCRVHAPSSGVVPTSSMTKDPRPCLSLPYGLEGFFRLHSHRLPLPRASRCDADNSRTTLCYSLALGRR